MWIGVYVNRTILCPPGLGVGVQGGFRRGGEQKGRGFMYRRERSLCTGGDV